MLPMLAFCIYIYITINCFPLEAIILFAWDHVARHESPVVLRTDGTHMIENHHLGVLSRYYYLTYVFYQVIIIGSLVAEVRCLKYRPLWRGTLIEGTIIDYLPV